MANSKILEYVLKIRDEASKEVNSIAENIGAKFGVSGTAVKYATAGLALIGTAAVMVGKHAFEVGVAYEKATSIIIKGTGASGKALDDLKDNFRFVNKMVPESADIVAGALADINTRLGLTGGELEIAAQNFLDFARINNQDVSTSIQQVTRLMGDWGVEAHNNEITLDLLSKVAQDTGASIDQLAQDSVTYGVQLRTLGFTMEESVAILGKFEKEGVATSKVFSGLSIAMANLAEKGGDIPTEFNKAIDAIKRADNDAKATTISMELFGRRAGPDLAIAVREGRFEIEEYMELLGDYAGTTYETAQQSLLFSQKLEILNKKVSDALAPLGEFIVDGLIRMIDTIENGILVSFDMWTQAQEKVGSAIQKVWDFLVMLFKPALDELWGTIQNSLLPELQRFWATVKNDLLPALKQLWDFISPVLIPILKFLAIALGAILYGALIVVIKVLETTIKMVSTAIKWFNNFVDAIRSIPGKIKGALEEAGNLLQKLNPFHRNSPSLVDNVLAGVKLIKKEYDSITDMQLPTMSEQYAPALAGIVSGGSSVSNNYSTQAPITVHANINNDMDAQQLAGLIGLELEMRGRY